MSANEYQRVVKSRPSEMDLYCRGTCLISAIASRQDKQGLVLVYLKTIKGKHAIVTPAKCLYNKL